jgi:hypothetical protein
MDYLEQMDVQHSGVHPATVVRQRGPRQQRPPIGGGVALSGSGGGRLGSDDGCRRNAATVSVLAAQGSMMAPRLMSASCG